MTLRPQGLSPLAKRLPVRRKAVTLIAGFRGYDGIVLCSDTQETIEQSHKRRVSKLRIEPSQEKGETELAIAFCGSGNNGPFIDKLINLAWEDVQVATSFDDSCSELEKSIKKTYKEFGQIYQRGYCPEAELIYGVKMQHQTKLFHALGPVVNEKEYYSAGSGQYMADFISAKMLTDDMNVKHLLIIAAYVLFQAKEYVDGVGGDTEIGILRNDGLSGRVDAEHISNVTEILSWNDKDLARALLFCADFTMKGSALKQHLKNLAYTLGVSHGLGVDKVKEAREKKIDWAMMFNSLLYELDETGIQKPRQRRTPEKQRHYI